MKKYILMAITTVAMFSCKNEAEQKVTEIDYRPQYHFTADSNWINDPNGLVYHDGEYHLFYQYNPFGTNWGHMAWGHSVSSDLLQWKTLPVALYEDKNFHNKDSSMIFSGSAVMDTLNTSGFGTGEHPPMVAVYTSFEHKGRRPGTSEYIEVAQTQSIAYSIDKGRTWKKYEGNPVLDVGSMDYRDPKVFWYAPQQKWVLLLVKSDRQEVWFYESKNLKEWSYMSRWGRKGNTATVWECPDLMEMNVAGTNEKKWVLLVSAGHRQEKYVGMQYFVGDFNGKEFTTQKDYTEPVYLDYGKDFYAAVSYNNLSTPRKIIVGWASNWTYAREIPTGSVWRGLYAVPREFELIKSGTDLVLIQKPVQELIEKRKEVLSLSMEVLTAPLRLKYAGLSYEMEFTLDPKQAVKAGVKLLKSANEETVLSFDKKTGELMLDRTRSGNVSFSTKFPSVEMAPVALKDGKLKIRVLVDKCIVEVFVNDGETVLTDLVFPNEKEGLIEFFSEGDQAVISDLKIWEIKTNK
ncbi:glycoside hydrolase family 32 protein [Lacibacter sp. H375]|uniref:glycoside hydrolase family 32 protein n=1 Tax=Lacibacter sp. H375 TaxID=3133424 RepID=UPI0030C2CF57